MPNQESLLPSRRHLGCVVRRRTRTLQSRIALLAPAALVLFAAACSESPQEPLAPADVSPVNAPAALLSPSSLVIWWPAEGAHVSGTQPLKALVSGYSVSSYTMTWQVDGGALNAMVTNKTDAPHKEASVN